MWPAQRTAWSAKCMFSGCAMRKEPYGWWRMYICSPCALWSLYDETLITTREALQSPLQQRAANSQENAKTASAVQKVTQRLVYLTSGRWQSICRYFWARSWRSPPSSPCRRAAAALHQTRSICSQTQSACSACLPRSRPSSKQVASARTRERAQPREQLGIVIRGTDDEDGGDGDGGGDVLKRRCRSLRDDGARSGAAWQADRLTSSQSCGREVM